MFYYLPYGRKSPKAKTSPKTKTAAPTPTYHALNPNQKQFT